MRARRLKLATGSVAALLLALVAWGVMVPTSVMYWDGYVPAREIRFSGVDAAGKPIGDLVVERKIGDTRHRPGRDWHPVTAANTEGGVLRIGIGARETSGSQRRHFWGLYTRQHDDNARVAYRVLHKMKECGSWQEEQLMAVPPDAVIPLGESVFGAGFDPLLGSPPGKTQVANITMLVR